MSPFDSPELILFVTVLIAAAVTGGLGFGFSSLTVPVALVLVTSRVLNPALVLLEVILNGFSLVLNRGGVRTTWRRMLPLVIGLLPGVALGGALLALTASLVLKAGTYAVLLPLVLLQLGSTRFRIPFERRSVGVPTGTALGVLYATTTISGPPLAMILGGQQLSPDEFRAAMALVRLIQSVVTLATYAALGLVQPPSLELFVLLLPAVAIGAPLGRLLLGGLEREAFRRLWTTVVAGLICSGFAISLHQLGWVNATLATAGAAAVASFVVGSEWQKLRTRRREVATR
jgi:uncharacterized membrane protein YfcA